MQKVNYGMGGMYVYPARQGVVPAMHPFYRTEAMGVPAPQIFHPLPPHYSPSITPTTATITGNHTVSIVRDISFSQVK